MNRDRQGRQTPSRARRLFADNLPIPGNPTLGATLDTSDEFVASNGSQSPSNDILNNIPGDIPTTEPSNRRKRGPSKGIGEWERGQKQMVLTTNEHGQPMGPGKVMEAFQTRAGIIARRDIPICYLDWRNVPQTFKDDAIKCLGVQFRYDYQESIDSIYTRKKINEAWRNYKHELYVEYVKDQNSTMVKEGPPPRGIPIEDWRQFVDNCHSLKFQSSSEKNTINIGKECSLLGGWPPRIVAKGIVEEVTPFNEFGQRRLGEGNYKVYVNVIHDPNGLLPCPHDQYFTTLGQIGQGSVIWPKKYLEFQS